LPAAAAAGATDPVPVADQAFALTASCSSASTSSSTVASSTTSPPPPPPPTTPPRLTPANCKAVAAAAEPIHCGSSVVSTASAQIIHFSGRRGRSDVGGLQVHGVLHRLHLPAGKQADVAVCAADSSTHLELTWSASCGDSSSYLLPSAAVAPCGGPRMTVSANTTSTSADEHVLYVLIFSSLSKSLRNMTITSTCSDVVLAAVPPGPPRNNAAARLSRLQIALVAVCGAVLLAGVTLTIRRRRRRLRRSSRSLRRLRSGGALSPATSESELEMDSEPDRALRTRRSSGGGSSNSSSRRSSRNSNRSNRNSNSSSSNIRGRRRTRHLEVSNTLSLADFGLGSMGRGGSFAWGAEQERDTLLPSYADVVDEFPVDFPWHSVLDDPPPYSPSVLSDADASSSAFGDDADDDGLPPYHAQ
jgi:hypothetical protein